jgi:hypothetical protein
MLSFKTVIHHHFHLAVAVFRVIFALSTALRDCDSAFTSAIPFLNLIDGVFVASVVSPIGHLATNAVQPIKLDGRFCPCGPVGMTSVSLVEQFFFAPRKISNEYIRNRHNSQDLRLKN